MGEVRNEGFNNLRAGSRTILTGERCSSSLGLVAVLMTEIHIS